MFRLLNSEKATMREVAARCRVHISTVSRWILHGVRGRRLRTILVGGRRFVLEDDLNSFLIATNVPGDALAESRESRAANAGRVLDGLGVKPR